MLSRVNLLIRTKNQRCPRPTYSTQLKTPWVFVSAFANTEEDPGHHVTKPVCMRNYTSKRMKGEEERYWRMLRRCCAFKPSDHLSGNQPIPPNSKVSVITTGVARARGTNCLTKVEFLISFCFVWSGNRTVLLINSALILT